METKGELCHAPGNLLCPPFISLLLALMSALIVSHHSAHSDQLHLYSEG